MEALKFTQTTLSPFWNIGDICYDIGTRFGTGKDCEKNLELAAIWLALAAIVKNKDAQIELGVMLANGRGVPVDVKNAINLVGEIANQGDNIAITELNEILLTKGGNSI